MTLGRRADFYLYSLSLYTQAYRKIFVEHLCLFCWRQQLYVVDYPEAGNKSRYLHHHLGPEAAHSLRQIVKAS